MGHKYIYELKHKIKAEVITKCKHIKTDKLWLNLNTKEIQNK